LTWDNYDSSISGNNATQSPVYIALEFFNDYKDFWGNANLVRKGGTFYIIGKIDPSVSYVAAANGDPEVGGVSNTLNLTRADNYALPPYDPESGATIQAPRVFIQDYVTNVDFIIGAESLKHAYITVPDLRSSQISLGLSVDVHWETGLDFRSIVLGE